MLLCLQRMRLCSSVTDFEVQRAKNQLKMQLLLQRNSTMSSCKHIARYDHHGVCDAEFSVAYYVFGIARNRYAKSAIV